MSETTAQFEAEAESIAAAERKLAERRVALATSQHTIIDEDGSHVGTSDVNGTQITGSAVEVWSHGELDFMGDSWQYRAPKPLAAMFLAIASRKSAPAEKKVEAIMGFLEHTLSESSMERLQERANDHDDPFDVGEMSELVGKIASAGSDRPTK